MNQTNDDLGRPLLRHHDSRVELGEVLQRDDRTQMLGQSREVRVLRSSSA